MHPTGLGALVEMSSQIWAKLGDGWLGAVACLVGLLVWCQEMDHHLHADCQILPHEWHCLFAQCNRLIQTLPAALTALPAKEEQAAGIYRMTFRENVQAQKDRDCHGVTPDFPLQLSYKFELAVLLLRRRVTSVIMS